MEERYNNEAKAYYEKGDIETAINRYNVSLALEEDQMYIRYNRALCYMEINKPDMAIEDCNYILEYSSTSQLTSDLFGDAIKLRDKRSASEETNTSEHKVSNDNSNKSSNNTIRTPPRFNFELDRTFYEDSRIY